MRPTIGMSDAERELATLRCLVAQQLHAIDPQDRGGPDRRAADLLLRRLLRREEDLRRAPATAVGAAR